MNVQFSMCNLYIRDKVKSKGWEYVNIFQKCRSMLFVLWKDRQKIWNIVNKKYCYLRQVELVLTTKCSLRCKDCANLMQYYDKPYEIDKSVILNAIHNLLLCVDEINTVVLVGGEPFLYKDVPEIIEYVAKDPKVNNIDIFTNGTIIPKQSTALQNPKVRIIISDYGEISRRKYELQAYCESNKINYHLKNKDLFWGYVGGMQARRRTEKQLARQFKRCHNFCRSILNGKLFYCPRAAHGDDLGYVNTLQNEYVELLKNSVSVKDILRIVYSDHFFSACDYCNYGTKEMVPIKPGVQVRKGEKKEVFEK